MQLREQSTTSRGSGLRVLHTLSGLQVGGIARLLLRNIRALESRGIANEVAYLTPRRNLEDAYLAEGVAPICMGHRSTILGPRTCWRLIRLIRRLEPDIVHTNHPLDRLYAGLAARLCHVPAVTTIHETFHTARGKVPRGRSWLERRLFSLYFAVSEAAADVHVRSRGVPRGRVEVIRSGIDPAELGLDDIDPHRVATLQKEFALRPEAPVLINVARLSAPKGHAHLVPMMLTLRESHPEAILLIVGDGAERSSLETAIEAAGLEDSIRLVGYRSDVPELLSCSAIFVFPSVRGEGLPMAVVEAMFAGKPIVAAATGPLREMVQEGENGHLVEPGDGPALARAVCKILGSPSGVRDMGRRSRALADRRFHIDIAAEKLRRAYLRVMEENR